jgi:serine phosphatase RsbU (regulator of sigma subunit)
VANQLMSFTENSSTLAKKEKEYILNSLYYYCKYFRMLARIERKIGVRGRNGALDKSKKIFDMIAVSMENLDNDLKLIGDEHKEKLKRDTMIVVTILVIVLVGTILLLTRLITRSVKTVSTTFNKYITSGFNFDSVSYKRSMVMEFNSIYVSFLKMAKEIHIFTNFFREKVHERTLEINQRKEEIQQQQQQIEKQYQSLLKKTDQLKRQKLLLAIKNTDIHDSLRYAKRIQKAIQPKAAAFKECFADSFIYSKAKDVVSGDFYLVYRINQDDQTPGRIVFVASDCTGHGVPGALMSVLGINTINKLVGELKILDPGQILRLLDHDINKVLAIGKKQHDIVDDGMDISVFSFDPQTYRLEYSIAKYSHFLVRDSSIIHLDTQKFSIGYSTFEHLRKDFSTYSFQIQPGDCLYLFSDGFADQFGGPQNKKYKKSNILQLIENVHTKTMDEQKEHFKQEFRSWKGSLKQTDDVTMIGIRF